MIAILAIFFSSFSAQAQGWNGASPVCPVRQSYTVASQVAPVHQSYAVATRVAPQPQVRYSVASLVANPRNTGSSYQQIGQRVIVAQPVQDQFLRQQQSRNTLVQRAPIAQAPRNSAQAAQCCTNCGQQQQVQCICCRRQATKPAVRKVVRPRTTVVRPAPSLCVQQGQAQVRQLQQANRLQTAPLAGPRLTVLRDVTRPIEVFLDRGDRPRPTFDPDAFMGK